MVGKLLFSLSFYAHKDAWIWYQQNCVSFPFVEKRDAWSSPKLGERGGIGLYSIGGDDFGLDTLIAEQAPDRHQREAFQQARELGLQLFDPTADCCR
jgi:hypothetical protein